MAHAVFGHHVRTAPGGEGNRLAGIGRPDPHRPNAGYVIGKETFAWARGSGRDAPFAAIRRILSTAARFGLSLLQPAAGPGLATCHRGFLRRSPARRGSGELKVDRHADPALPVDLRAGNARLGVGRFDRDAMLGIDTVHWHCPSLSRVQPFGLPWNDGT